MALLKAACFSLLLVIASAAKAPAGAPAAATGSAGLPAGFGQVEAQLRAEVPWERFQTQLSSIGGQYGSNVFGDLRYIIGQTNQALFTLPNQGLSQGKIDLKGCALWAPHYHPRASEILYVTEVQAADPLEMGFSEENPVHLEDGSDVAGRLLTYHLGQGDSLIVPQGLIHYVYNPGCTDASIITNFDNRDPGVVSILQSLFRFAPNIVIAASGLPDSAVQIVNTTAFTKPIISRDEDCAAKCGFPAVRDQDIGNTASAPSASLAG